VERKVGGRGDGEGSSIYRDLGELHRSVE
jgi:hypothetical protein